VPLHWTSLLGGVTVSSLAVLFITGLLLMLMYTPSSEVSTYTGPYTPLRDREASRAFISVMRLSFELPGGLLVRQLHHWAGLILPAAIMLQMLVVFFTGAFRRPRRFSWVLLFLLYIAVLAGGWSGYALPDDMLSGSGLRITHGIVLGVPLIGPTLAKLMFGGEFPGTIIETLYGVHVYIVPAAVLILVAVRAWRAWRVQPPQFAGAGRREGNIVGLPLFPNVAVWAGGFAAVVAGVLVLIAAMVTVAPVWIYGPADPGNASAGSQPDWYTGFLDGALRLVPPGWEFEWLERTWSLAILAPLAVVGVFLLCVATYPLFEEWIARDKSEHHLLDRPRNVATRTGIGVAGIVFYAVLWGAASADIVSVSLTLTLESVIASYQAAAIFGPVLGYFAAKRICLALQKKDRDLVQHGYETGRVVRTTGGGYIEVHQPLSDEEKARLTAHARVGPVLPPPDEGGSPTRHERLRRRLGEWFFADRIEIIGFERTTTEPGPTAPSAKRPASPSRSVNDTRLKPLGSKRH
jgi:ubiquinol-cytochrome c reductase cytochrome b subunit